MPSVPLPHRGNIGRSVFDPVTEAAKPFVSAYASAMLPNVWH